ncbi:MAG TPA: response regulator, partial [Flavisolibacter sp.]|nr:response regulator [Flavisolibacter sp.]
LPEEKIKSSATGISIFKKKDAFIEEALKWLPSETGSQEALLTGETGPVSNNGQEQGKPLILLADDNADMREYITRLLSPAYHVVAVENGKKAITKINAQIPDLILSDVMMPEMDGFELVRKLKSNTRFARIPILLLSARAGEEATLEGLQTGADDYLVKPFSARELISRINSTLKLALSRKEAEQQYSDLFLQAPIAICMLKGPEMIIELANHKYLELAGKDETIITKPLLEALPELNNQSFPSILEYVYTSGIPYFGNEAVVFLNRYGKSQKCYVNFVYHPVHNQNGSTYSILVIAYDVTELVESRQKLIEAEERMRIATDGTGLGTWDLNLLTGKILYTPRLNEIFGYDRSKVLSHLDMRNHIHPDDRSCIVEKAFEESMTTGVYYYEARIVWDNGILKWIRTQGKVLYDEKGKPVRVLGTMMDITEQKAAQKALQESEERYRQLAEELDMRVQQRTKDLSEANENLAISNRELEQFAFVTSHDLQEPLRKIQTFANMLVERNKNQLDERAVSYLDKMMNASQRMSKLISDLLNFSRLRRSEERFVPTDLNEILSNIINDFELLISQKKAKIIADRLPMIIANPLQMNQLFYNLISNALKFSRPDIPPVIEISCRLVTGKEVAHQVPLNPGTNYIELIVRDNGIGFAQQYAEKIFEIFQRLNARSEYEGTGIGLALVNKIVEHHKGTIYAVSEEGKGSAFYLLLPEGE